MNDFVIKTNHLSKLYDGKRGCENISLEVPRGGVFGFFGPNGAGKSTFVRMMLGLIQPTSGAGEMLGKPIGTVESRTKVGYLPELFRYPDWLTGKQLLENHAQLCQIPIRNQKNRIEEVIEIVGMTGREKEKIRGYSKGMQQRIGLACALLNDPDLLFLDEPTSALDPVGRKEVRDLIARLSDEGKTVFLNSHLLAEAESVCDHMAIIYKGELLVQGRWRELAEVKTQVEIAVGEKTDNLWEQQPTFVKKYETLSSKDDKQHWLITLNDEANIPHLVRTLQDNEKTLYQLTPKEPHLEEIFLHWVTKKEMEVK
ncbi:ABC transporter ATP-binding protein [Bacillus solimangrovi]|uniref:Multidrug ABC transporter ATP-binding protein n=1 Tax=Bacillus solimangrovi TaxID=1305675 RepID=A0A1E5LHE3_9BACI|nr:ABC transporter ATP-binding protein [Bacillus solimangrovi]OEH93498.1 multidrug ABC transporter ATP-binding protein [Bacillus solimangrovi]